MPNAKLKIEQVETFLVDLPTIRPHQLVDDDDEGPDAR